MVCSSVLPTRLQPQPRPVQGQGEILLSIFIGANACVSVDRETHRRAVAQTCRAGGVCSAQGGGVGEGLGNGVAGENGAGMEP